MKAELEFDLVEFGNELMQWNAGQGDPVYAVASYAVAGMVHPNREVVAGCLQVLERLLARFEGGACSESNDLGVLVDHTGLLLEQFPETTEE